jgi:hypothetical protein
MVYLGACLIAGIRLARERQVNERSNDFGLCRFGVWRHFTRSLLILLIFPRSQFITIETKAEQFL